MKNSEIICTFFFAGDKRINNLLLKNPHIRHMHERQILRMRVDEVYEFDVLNNFRTHQT